MPTRAGSWMKWVACLTLTQAALGCVNVGSERAICDGTQAARTAHAAALAQDGGDLSVATGAYLIQLIDAGCGDAT